MKNVIYIVLTALLCFIAWKFGDKHGFEEGYQVGYTYDCRDEIKSLQDRVNALAKSTKFAREATTQVKERNSYLEWRAWYMENKNPNYIQDSIKNADLVKNWQRPKDCEFCRMNPDGKVDTMKGLQFIIESQRAKDGVR